MSTPVHYFRREMGITQYLNYLALDLIHLAGNDQPTEREIQKLEQQLMKLLRMSYRKI